MTARRKRMTHLRARLPSVDLDRGNEGAANEIPLRGRALKLKPCSNSPVGMRTSFVEMALHLAGQWAEQEPALPQPAGIAAPEVVWAGVRHRKITLYSVLAVSHVDTVFIFGLQCKKNIDKPELNQQKPPRWDRSPSHARRGCSVGPFCWEKGQFWGRPVASWVSLEGGRGDADGLSAVVHAKKVKGSDTNWSPTQAGDKEQILARSSRGLDCLWLWGVSCPRWVKPQAFCSEPRTGSSLDKRLD